MKARPLAGGPRRSLPARALPVGVACTVVAASSLIAVAPSNAAETYGKPVDNIITLNGHGFGHGHGMSQWGAYGAAKVGKLSWKSILSFYYPGTALTNLGNPTIRVRLDSVGQGALRLPTPAGLTLAGRLLPATISGHPVTAYRVSPHAAGDLQVDAFTAAAGWTLYRFQPSPAVLTNPLQGNVVDVLLAGGSKRGYRGSIVANRVTATSLTTVSAVPTESYLRAVVPAEMPASWHPNALAAQAVAARSYASYGRLQAKAGSIWDTCDTTFCQMYSGVGAELATSSAAVVATAGQVLTSAGKVAFTQFSAANGGFAASGGQSYLMAKTDPYDGAIPNAANSWSKDITVASIQSRWPSIGTYRQLRILSRDGNGPGGGRVLSAAVDGSAGSVTVTGRTMAGAFGLRSEWFTPTNPLPTTVLPAPVAAPAPHVVTPAPHVSAPAPRVAAPVRRVAPRAPAWTLTRYTPYKKVVLRQGSMGAAVVVLQRALRVTPDGHFGAVTRAAVLAYQKQQRLAGNGIVSALVWNRIEKRDYPLIAYRGLVQRQGARGAVTVVIQRALRQSANGMFGSRTTAAVKAVQRRARLAQTGVVSGGTWVAIESQMPR